MSFTYASAQLRGQPVTRRLDLVRRVQALPSRVSSSMPTPDRVAEPEAAEVRADARLDRAHGLRVGVAGRHPELLPDRREVLLADAEQVDPLAAGDLHQRHLVLVGDVGDPAQLVGRRDAAADARHDGERAVVLDVRVDAVVDEARVALLAVAVAVDLARRGRRGRLAGAALAARRRTRARQLARPTRCPRSRTTAGQLLARLVPARAEVGRLLGGAAALDRAAARSTTRLARAAAGAGARDGHDLARRAEAARRGSRRRSRPCRRRCSCRPARVSGRSAAVACDASASSASGSSTSLAGAHRVDQQLGAARVAEQDRADGAAVGVDDELAVDAGGVVGDDDLAVARRRRRRRRGRRPSTLSFARRDRAGVGGLVAGQRVARRPAPARGSARRCRGRRRGAGRTRRRRARAGRERDACASSTTIPRSTVEPDRAGERRPAAGCRSR